MRNSNGFFSFGVHVWVGFWLRTKHTNDEVALQRRYLDVFSAASSALFVRERIHELHNTSVGSLVTNIGRSRSTVTMEKFSKFAFIIIDRPSQLADLAREGGTRKLFHLSPFLFFVLKINRILTHIIRCLRVTAFTFAHGRWDSVVLHNVTRWMIESGKLWWAKHSPIFFESQREVPQTEHL